jgi:hydroxymethylbilane synthase
MRWVSKNFETFGDSNLDSPLPEMGGKGAFTEELDRALLEGRIDLAVHSLKDLLVDLPKGIKIGAILDRVEPRDVLICQRRSTLDQLPAAAVVGTSSLRRQAQLLNARPDLSVKSIRGNVPTRIDKVITGQYDAVVLAGAGVIRLGLEEKISEWLPLEVMLPAPGQGALAVTCRDSDTQLIASLALIHDPVAAICVDAERQFLAAFGGGCSAPIAACAIAISTVPIEIKLTGRVASVDGQQMMTRETIGKDPEILACDLARQLIECGAMRIIADWQRRLATLNPRLHIK